MSGPQPKRPHLGGEDAAVIVLIGGTGAGKTMLAEALGGRGAFVLDADRIGHEVLLDAGLRRAVVEAFGATILDGEGEIDRRRLGPLVFASDEARRRINGLVHPSLVAEIARRIDRLRESRATTLIVIDAALWLQFPDPPCVDLVVGVDAPVALRCERIMRRDGLEPEAAQARLEGQAGMKAFLQRADAVLDSSDSPQALRAALYSLLDERLGTRLGASDPDAFSSS